MSDDAVVREPWPTWKKIVAYLVLAALACGAIWVVDLKVNAPVPGQGAANQGHVAP
jgi:hypothetical protein